jgi:hypothetical protein
MKDEIYVIARAYLHFARSNLLAVGDCFAAKPKSAARNDIRKWMYFHEPENIPIDCG